MSGYLFRKLDQSGKVTPESCLLPCVSFLVALWSLALMVLAYWSIFFHARTSHNHKTHWDPGQPCTFVLWHKSKQTRYCVIGYSLHEFCDLMKFSYSDVVGSFFSKVVEPKGYYVYASGVNLDASFHPAAKPTQEV